MNEHGIPIDDPEGEASSSIHILAMTADETLGTELTQAMTARSFALTLSSSMFDAGKQTQSFVPDAIIIDCSSGIREATQMADALRKDPDFAHTLFYALSSDEGCQTCEEAKGIEVFRKPFDANLLAERIKTVLSSRGKTE